MTVEIYPVFPSVSGRIVHLRTWKSCKEKEVQERRRRALSDLFRLRTALTMRRRTAPMEQVKTLRLTVILRIRLKGFVPPI